MSSVAIITARGGSKRIPRKNIRPFLGKPIIAYVIDAALQSDLFDEVMVSTDDSEIADIARQYGASVPFLRKAETADDYATTAQVLEEVLGQYARQGQVFDYACCLYPTAPFVTAELLQRAFEALTEKQFDSVYPIQSFSFPIQRAVLLRESKVEWFQPEHALTRSQDLEPAYHDAGQFYFFQTAAFQQKQRLITDNSGGIVISEMDAHDIDTETDWQVAELKFKLVLGVRSERPAFRELGVADAYSEPGASATPNSQLLAPNPNKLLFRADGDARIGMGHVMRCLALANMLQGEYTMQFAITEPTSTVRELIETAGLTVISIPKLEGESAFLATINPDQLVVLDGYSFDELFQQSVRSKAKKLVFIDDLLTGHQVADVVINHAGGLTEADYEAEVYTQFCLGPHYALLRPEFLNSSGFGTPPADGPVFVSLGGADPNNTSLTVLEAIRQVDSALPVHIVLGPFHPDRASIDEFKNQLPNLTILQNLNASQMVDELAACRLAITACSTIAYEVCAINRPLITIVTADNQARLAQFLSEEKLALSVNFPTLLTRLTPVLGLDQMLKLSIQGFQFSPDTVDESLANQRRFFDGRSPERFRALFRTLSEVRAV